MVSLTVLSATHTHVVSYSSRRHSNVKTARLDLIRGVEAGHSRVDLAKGA
jgi:hypothetical protein